LLYLWGAGVMCYQSWRAASDETQS